MTAGAMVQHAAGGTEKMQGCGMLSFIKYDSRTISIGVLSALLLTTGVAQLTDLL